LVSLLFKKNNADKGMGPASRPSQTVRKRYQNWLPADLSRL